MIKKLKIDHEVPCFRELKVRYPLLSIDLPNPANSTKFARSLAKGEKFAQPVFNIMAVNQRPLPERVDSVFGLRPEIGQTMTLAAVEPKKFPFLKGTMITKDFVNPNDMRGI